MLTVVEPAGPPAPVRAGAVTNRTLATPGVPAAALPRPAPLNEKVPPAARARPAGNRVVPVVVACTSTTENPEPVRVLIDSVTVLAVGFIRSVPRFSVTGMPSATRSPLAPVTVVLPSARVPRLTVTDALFEIAPWVSLSWR